LTPEDVPLPKPDTSPPAKPKAKSFRIGGKAKKSFEDTPPPAEGDMGALPPAEDNPIREPPSSQLDVGGDTSPKKAKRNFRIGGKRKGAAGGSSQTTEPAPAMADRSRHTHSPSSQPPSSPPIGRIIKEQTPIVEEEHEETPEEKAERRRAELKRKTEEAAKKQAQSKKKRRF
jgi:hypothetical protein